jgi:MFS family permease
MPQRPPLPREVWSLGLVSLLMDASSELIHSLLPVFIVTTLGAGPAALGLLEGVAEATALIVKVFSGTLSDWWGRRKSLVLLGYGLGAVSKPFFAAAPDLGWVFGARFADRCGKGLRGAPRDALIADVTPPEARGAAYGLRQSLDSVGAFVGPMLAVVLMPLLKDDIRGVFWFASIPAAACVLVLAFGVREPAHVPRAARLPIRRDALARLPQRYWRVVALGAVFMLSRFSEAFLVLRASRLGLAMALTPLVFVLMNAVYAAAAYPAGLLADRLSRRSLLAVGLALLAAADAALAGARSLKAAALGIVLWGLHMGLTQGVLSALVAQEAPEDLRGTAFGVFNLVAGLAALASSALAGGLWQWAGAPAAFYAGAALAVLSLALLARL